MGGSGAVVAVFVLLASGVSETPAAATPAGVCATVVTEYESPPAGAVVVDPARDGDLAAATQAGPAGTTFWLKPGTHTLGADAFGQVQPKDGDTYLGAPGAVLDGRNVNHAAFTGRRRT